MLGRCQATLVTDDVAQWDHFVDKGKCSQAPEKQARGCSCVVCFVFGFAKSSSASNPRVLGSHMGERRHSKL